MKLNVACGAALLRGYVNVDVRRDVRADVVCDCMGRLPFADASFDEVRVDDFLEHVYPDLQEFVVGEWRRVLRAGGVLVVRVPNLLSISEQIVRGDPGRQALLIRNVYGGHRWGLHGEWDTHHAGWTPELLRLFLAARGFRVVSNDQALNMTAKAVPA